ncbi:MAG: mycothiol transferase [Acidimicrobiales bacterium]
MATDEEMGFPGGGTDERELLLGWLGYLRGAVLRKVEDLADDDARRWRPEGRLIPLLGVAAHLAAAEWRWIDGSMLGQEVSRSEDEFSPGPELTVEAAVAAYLGLPPRTTSGSQRRPAADGEGTHPGRDSMASLGNACG